ncbi:MAG: hypothetical protein VCB99_13520 [Myxococcota bacterium]
MSRWQRYPDAQAPNPMAKESGIQEERRLNELLKMLPEPEPPAYLASRVMARIHAYEVRPRGIRRFLQGLAPMRTAAVLAGGLATWMFLVGGPYDLVETGRSEEQPVAAPERSLRRTATQSPQPRRPPVQHYSVSAGAMVNPMGFFPGQPQRHAPILTAQQVLPPLDRRLDHQIDHLLHNPDAFFRRFARIREGDRYLERLANRSARRGDAADVGLRVRAIQHPMAPQVSERFLRAPLIPAAARR